ncbi:MAG: hypothetical protein Q7J35_12170 [Candidatus Methanoperedens sp.]|nr:hypothetical protein [Candidatus Methanoperedens sp.]
MLNKNRNWTKPKKLVIALILVVGLLFIYYFGLFIFFITGLSNYEDTTIRSHYTFSIEMTTNSTLENLTFIVPIPGNDTLVIMALDDSVHDFFTPQQKADGWNISIIETEYGKMFKITAKEFAPQTTTLVELDPKTDLPTGKNNRTSIIGNREVSVTMIADHIIDTVNASENEPVLSQKSNKSMIYADYTSSPNAYVEVFVNLEGGNEWWQGRGWAGNQYQDRLGTAFTGEKHGWFSVPRELASRGSPLPAQTPNPLS